MAEAVGSLLFRPVLTQQVGDGGGAVDKAAIQLGGEQPGQLLLSNVGPCDNSIGLIGYILSN